MKRAITKACKPVPGPYPTRVLPVLFMLLLGVPLILLVLWSVSDSWFPPGLWPQTFTVAHWRHALDDALLGNAVLLSLGIAAGVTLPCALISIAPAWAISRLPARQRRAVELVVLMPLIVPGIVIATGLGKILLMAHLSFTWPGVVLAQLVGTMPLMIRVLSASFAGIPNDVISAARSLGASAMATAWHIGLPAARLGLLGGGLVVFASSLEEFDKTFIVGAPNIQTLPVLLYLQMDGAGIIFPDAAVASLILLTCGLLVFLPASHILRKAPASDAVLHGNRTPRARKGERDQSIARL